MNVDQYIDYFSRRTHSPQGRYAANDETYRQLLDRLSGNDSPRQDLPVRSHAITRRWRSAASAALIVGIGVAIAGVYTYRRGFFTGNDHLPEVPSTETITSAETLIFDNTPLSQIAVTLSEVYQTDISVSDPAIADYRITATFSTDEPLEDILDAITDVSGLAYRKVDGGFMIHER